MKRKYLFTVRNPADREKIMAAGCDILAEYPDAILLRCNADRQAKLKEAGLESTELLLPPVTMAGASFEFSAAMEAQIAAPISLDSTRLARYLVQLAGPIKGEWLKNIEGVGGKIHGSLPGFRLIVGMLPAHAAKLGTQPWVEGVTPYRPAMKVSPKLRPGVTRQLGAAELKSIEVAAAPAEKPEQVEISVFPGESTAEVAATIRQQGGTVLREAGESVIAVVQAARIPLLAEKPAVQSILPHLFPELHNDRAATIMQCPADRIFGSLTLRGAGERVAVCDTGLDTGNPATIHPDFAGRLAGVVSWPTAAMFAPYTTDPPGSDDGPADGGGYSSGGHGTHVAGSVLGNGAAAVAAGSAVVPTGIAPEAELYFQAVVQTVHWKTAAQLAADGLAPFTAPWPPPSISLWGLPDDLNDLFDAAYAAGARIHTNSWGAAVAGEYSVESRQVDQFMWNHRDMLILFSAGNSGRDASGDGVIDADSMGAPGTAKNCLTVGATENNRPHGSVPTPGLDANWSALIGFGTMAAAGHVSDNVDGMAAFSSRGPTDDGRLKPEVVAPGTNVLSVRSQAFPAPPTTPLWGDVAAPNPLRGLYCWSGGTSMSTPLVAGAAALVREHLVRQRGHSDPVAKKPSGALIKAFLVNGTTTIPGQFAGEIPAGKNSVAGFGRVNLNASLIPGLLGQTLFADEPDHAVASGEMRTYEVQPVDLGQPLKVSLVWTDAPSPAGMGGLQNTLYLQVVPPVGATVDGDVTAFPLATNNVQQVIVAAPVVGTYQIRVRGVSVVQNAPGVTLGPNPRQDFAVAVSNAVGMSLHPVSIAQAIDTTGSMAYFGYIEPAKERARQLVDFLRINDKVSITEFSERAALPLARTVFPLRSLVSVTPDWTDARSAIAGLHADGLTPIGAGLTEAWHQIDSEPVARPRAIVLLSDGLNNRGGDPLTAAAAIPADIPIFTIALGPAGSVMTLQNIAASRPGGAYYLLETDQEIQLLHEIYAQVQALTAGSALIGLSTAETTAEKENSHVMPVEDKVKEVVFTLSCARVKDAVLRIIGPDGREYTAAVAATSEVSGDTYKIVRVAVPLAGPWTLRLRARNQKALKYTVSGAVQSAITFNAQAKFVEGGKLSISARLLSGGRAIREATVKAVISGRTVSDRDLITKHGPAIRKVKIPQAVDEPGLTQEQRLLLQLSVYLSQLGPRAAKLVGRKSVTVPLEQGLGGEWVSTHPIPIPMPASVTVSVTAEGSIKGKAFSRVATLACAALDHRGSLHIEKVSAGREGEYAVLSALVLDGTDVASPEEGTKVQAIFEGDGRGAKVRMVFDSASQLYRARRRFRGRALECTVHASQKSLEDEVTEKFSF